MKKTIISTALKLIPRSFQYKALCRSLDYLLSNSDIANFEGLVIELKVVDIGRCWYVQCNNGIFTPSKIELANLKVSTKLSVALNLNSKKTMLAALQKDCIRFSGEKKLTKYAKNLLIELDDVRLVNLSQGLSSFLKMKSNKKNSSVGLTRLNTDTVSLSDLKTELDINFIRNEAVKCEKTDLKKALNLMLLAQQARPNGPFIANKVCEYKRLLKLE